MKLKICGMTLDYNISEVASIEPEYIGFIFHEKSPRFFKGRIPNLPKHIITVGVFVNAPFEYIKTTVNKHLLKSVQLHGEESAEFCKKVKSLGVIVIKVFSIKNQFDFSVLEVYHSVCDYYLFDTKGKKYGGNGYTFNWNVLKKYPYSKPYFLSGGIGPKEIDSILTFLKNPESDLCCTLDLNSKFETVSVLKDIKLLKIFKLQLKSNNYAV